ncbi:solute carrier family 13 member 2-like isoform X2 [Mizuhopecten yessoensis]|uniref:solute carrier family 13 member 2-like isoform X2 n=1 Tax=Mizuhopecten yessoensis TaxID=6573 RepID=UPI000B45B2F9|nr:solute carrier family 13 member 2-like isoform X2 [Mizuhopecten yessoensis]
MAGTSCAGFFKDLWALRSIFLILIAFLVPIGFLLDGSLESKCAYVMVSMAILWFTEALPITATAMMPMFLLPLLAVQPGKVVCGNYFNDTSMLFLGGLIVGVAMEEVNLHRRIAMGITILLGSSPNTMMLGLMLPTWFLSMWISNTAATSMMLPILIAVSEQTTKFGGDSEVKSNGTTDVQDIQLTEVEHGNSKVEPPLQYKGEKSKPSKGSVLLNKGFTLSVAYAANVGGITTLTGTPPNLVLQGQADKRYQDYGAVDSGITYANWMAFAFPMSLIMLFLTWFWLQIVFIRCWCCKAADKNRQAELKAVVRREYNKLGHIKFGEIMVLVMFIILALLWLFRDLPDIGGWGDVFLDAAGKSTVRDSTASILVATLLFVLPKKLPNVFCWNGPSDSEKSSRPSYTPILTWHVAEKKVAWGVLVLLGGGFALADACTTSGLSRLVGCELRVLKGLDPWVMNMVLCFIVAGATEITSNTATASLLMPIMFELAITVGIHPLYLMMSACIACSFAFMLPVATPPNAIVFSTGTVRIPDMALAGIVLNMIAVGVLTLAINTWGTAIFKLDTFPEIFLNSTKASTCPGAAAISVIDTTVSLLNSTLPSIAP